MDWLTTRRTVLLVGALVVLLRLPTLLDSMYLVDEGYSGAIASEMMYGGTIYQTAVDTRAPFVYYVYYLVFVVCGQNNLLAVHILAMVFVFTTALIVMFTGRSIYGELAGHLAALSYVIFSHAFIPRDTLAANVEIFTLVPLSLGFLLYIRGERSGRTAFLVLSGVCCAVAMFFRQPSVVNLGVLVSYIGYRVWFARDLEIRRGIEQAIAVTIGFVSCAVLIMGFHYMQGNLNAMWEWSWLIAMRYVNSETTATYVVRRLFIVHGTYILSCGLLWYLGLKQLWRTVREFRQGRVEQAHGVLMALWFVAAYFSLFTGWRFPGHYHLTVLPPLAVLGGAAMSSLSALRGPTLVPGRARQRLLLLSAATVPALGFLVMAFVVREDTVAFRPISEYVASNTSEDDRIFVWGSAPHIYSFSNRRNATRFVSGSHLVGMYASRPHKEIDSTKWIVPGSWDMLDADFMRHPPELIVDMSTISSNWDNHPMDRYPVLERHLSKYSFEESVLGARIYRRTINHGSIPPLTR